MKNQDIYNNLPNNTKVLAIIDALEEMYPDAGCELNYDSVFHLLLAVVLSAQTTDVSVNKVTPILFERYKNPEELAAANQSDIEEIIHNIGLYKNKSKNIIALSQKLVEEYGGRVPGEMNELVKLPGVGRKTANVVLSEAFGEQRIAVDTHVFRVSNRLGLASADDVLTTEKQLMEVLPNDKWTRVHHLLIFHGRRCCTAKKPDCANCRLKDFCPAIDNI